MNGPMAFVGKVVVGAALAAVVFTGVRGLLAPDRALAQGAETLPAGNRNAGGGTADSDGNMIAVTGVSPTGAAVLYLADTRLKRLAVYQVTGKNIELVAARNIEYDLKLDAYHDGSPDEVQVPRMRERWNRAQGAKPADGGKDDGNK